MNDVTCRERERTLMGQIDDFTRIVAELREAGKHAPLRAGQLAWDAADMLESLAAALEASHAPVPREPDAERIERVLAAHGHRVKVIGKLSEPDAGDVATFTPTQEPDGGLAMTPDPDGEYVRLGDYESLAADLAESRREVAWLQQCV